MSSYVRLKLYMQREQGNCTHSHIFSMHIATDAAVIELTKPKLECVLVRHVLRIDTALVY